MECFAWIYLNQLIDKALQKIFSTFENSRSIACKLNLLQSHFKHYPTINILVQLYTYSSGYTQYFPFLSSDFFNKIPPVIIWEKIRNDIFQIDTLIKWFSLVCCKIVRFTYWLFKKFVIILISFSSTSTLFFFTH